LEPTAASPPSHPSALRAWGVLVVQSFQRHWRVRQMGWVSLGLLGVVVFWVALVTERGAWNLAEQRARRGAGTYRAEAERLLPPSRYRAVAEGTGLNELRPHEVPNPLDPTADALASLLLSVPHAVLASERFAHGWAFMTYSRWVLFTVFLGFVLPLFTLSYASGAFGTDRETRSLIWLMTRPIPRGGIYLAKFLGALPWCLAFGVGGFAAVCLAGGPLGREAFARFWPAAAVATLAFAALFHLIGALFRRPVVVGVVYWFFFEGVVAALPGSLKLLSLTFYARSLMYNEAAAARDRAGGPAEYPVELLTSMSAAVSSATAWAVLAAATVGITALGTWLFARSEYRDDV
jgi:ABC-type transport system involved in multi-copper enzyme maturation permease subunit